MALVVDPVQGSGGRHVPRRGPSSFADAGYCGRSFNEGLVRFHDSETAAFSYQSVWEAFPELRSIDRKADVLAFDWHGRQFLTAKVKGEGEIQIVVADISRGTLEVLAGVGQFAAVLTLDDVAKFFEGDLYDAWREAVGRPGAQLDFTDCVEFGRPIYMGGEETLENLKLNDLDVAWTFGAQVRPAVMELIEQGVDPSQIQFNLHED